MHAFTSSGLAAVPHTRHAFFGRQGGVSEGIYAALNCGHGSGDDPASVRENRVRALRHLDKTDVNLCTLYQIHSNTVVTVERPWAANHQIKADAMVTRTPGIALGILTADCAPVLFADRDKPIVGAAHAGWKGALGGIMQNTVKAMCALGASNIVACIGPCITKNSYEVGQDFFDTFENADRANVNFFMKNANKEKYLFDLHGYIISQMKKLDLQAIETIRSDTYAEAETFFSYRRACHRGESDYGRQLSAICIKSKR